MPFLLELPSGLAPWKVKIFDRERLEPPHATIVNGKMFYRWGLREMDFLDDFPPGRQVPGTILAFVRRNHTVLVAEWNREHADNPV
jgi:hypothetical protein